MTPQGRQCEGVADQARSKLPPRSIDNRPGGPGEVHSWTPGPDTCRRDRRPGESKQGQAWPLRCLFRRRANSSPPQSLRQARLRAARPGLACTFFPSTALSATSWSSVARGRGIRPSVRRTRGIASFRNLTAAGAIPARTLPSLEWDAYQHEPVTCVIPGARLCELHHPRSFRTTGVFRWARDCSESVSPRSCGFRRRICGRRQPSPCGANGPCGHVRDDENREADAVRALCRLFVRVLTLAPAARSWLFC